LPDKLITLPKSFPLIGNEINVLPILMAIGMFVQQKFTMPSTTSQQAEQQKMMAIMMPFLFGLIFYHMPSGLVLYWFVNSILMLAFQMKISRTK
jgi:YidC/Oxa1 family membrane protein insertase